MNILFIEPTQREMGTILLYLRAGWNVTIKQLEELKIDGMKNFYVVVDSGPEWRYQYDEIQSQNNAS